MKITCQSCQAKYTIADEKVVGKVVKIRCKKCGSTIVVNGNDPTASTTIESPEVARANDGGGLPDEGWTVNVAEGDQRTMTDAEVVSAFAAGTIDGETFCWKEGMDDWMPLREIDDLSAACTRAASNAKSATRAGAKRDAESETGGSGFAGGLSTAAARRGVGRAPAADLFGGVAQAGGEEDVLTSAPPKMPQASNDPQTRTGARNENSVLFSIGTLSKKSGSAPPLPMTGTTEASGLIDIRQLSAQLVVEDKKRSRVDDIMNLSGGGAFVPNLSAPLLTAPDPHEFARSGGLKSLAPSGPNKGLIFLALGAGTFLIVAAVGTATCLMQGKGPEMAAADPGRVAASATAESAATPSREVATAGPAGSETTAPAASAASSPVVGASGVAKEATNEPRPAPAPAPKEAKATTAAPVSGREPPKAAAIEVDQPFNMGEAKARLAAAAGGAGACKKPMGPTGDGHVVVVFATSGAAQSATVTGEPFEGTPTGACVASKFKAVRVPPFSGSPFSVRKTFTIN